jgi:hypothetical protein
MRDLQELSEGFSCWLNIQRKGRLAVTADPLMLRNLLLAGRQSTDSPPRQVIEDLGFGASLMTDDRVGRRLTLRATCGGYSPHVLNQCSIEIPTEGERSMIPTHTRVEALKVMIRTWSPEWGMLISSWDSHTAARKQHGVDLGLWCGEETFVRSGAPLPEAVRERFNVEEFPPHGNLIHVTKDTSAPGDVVKRLIDLHGILDRAGLYYRPTRKIDR